MIVFMLTIADRKKMKKKRKKPANLVSFEDDEGSSYSASPASSVTSPISNESYSHVPGSSVPGSAAIAVSSVPLQVGFSPGREDISCVKASTDAGSATGKPGPGKPLASLIGNTSPKKKTDLKENVQVSTGSHAVHSNVTSSARLESQETSAGSTHGSESLDITSPTINRLADLQNLIDNTQSTLAAHNINFETSDTSYSAQSREHMQILDRNVGWREAEASIITGLSGVNLSEAESEISGRGHKRSVSEGTHMANYNPSNRTDIGSISEKDRSSSLENNLAGTLPRSAKEWSRADKNEKTPSPPHGMQRWDSFTSNDSLRSVTSASSSFEERSQDFSNR